MEREIIKKREREKNIIRPLIWLNWSIETINATLQLVVIYKYRCRLC